MNWLRHELSRWDIEVWQVTDLLGGRGWNHRPYKCHSERMWRIFPPKWHNLSHSLALFKGRGGSPQDWRRGCYSIAWYAVGTPCKMGFPKGCQPHVVWWSNCLTSLCILVLLCTHKEHAVGIPRLARGEKDFNFIKTLLCKTNRIKHIKNTNTLRKDEKYG